ncbi:MAG TPA: alpha/beta hydrolase [Gammaproteobacteria bacterium]|nr:alpha/beta hydrolase [Gammaproteobacteria bacterium]
MTGITRLRPRFCLAFGCLLLAGCVAGPRARFHEAVSSARRAGLHLRVVDAGAFRLATWSRLTAPGKPVDVYIEGDGFAWVTPHRPSDNPTPIDPVGLKLAMADPGPNVVYLARPCQYVGVGSNPRCTVAMWTGKRYSAAVVTATNHAIDKLVGRKRKIELTGFSGGAAVAVLVAARRQDVVSLRTVAGEIDSAAFVRIHSLSPLSGSLDPAGVAHKLRGLPQLHLVGGDDHVIPIQVARAYERRAGPSPCIHVREIPGASHDHGWVKVWPRVLKARVECGRTPKVGHGVGGGRRAAKGR